MKQGLKPNAWTEAENDLMREHWPVGGLAAAHAAIPWRSRRAIQLHAQALKLRMASTFFTWTPERVAVLREHYPLIGSRGVSEMLGNVSKSAVQTKASVLGIKGCRKAGQRMRRKAAEERRAGLERNPNAFRVVAEKPNSEPVKIAPRGWSGAEATNPRGVKPIKCPSGEDMRYRVTSAPSVVDSRECRDWVKAATHSTAAT